MSDLRKAAEMALNYFEDAYWLEDAEVAIKEALRQALAHEALNRMVAENQRLGLYDDLQTAIEKGTKAWADVPDATEWAEEIRGNDTPQVTPEVTPQVTGEVTTEVPCKTHPDAPHGFNRSASFDEDRYVCDCEFWEPVDKVDMSEERVHKSDKSMHEPVAIVNAGMGYIAPYTKLDTFDGVSHKDRLIRIMGTFDLATGHADTMDQALDSLEEELRDVLGHLRARREWVGLTDEDLSVCDEDGVLLARYWETKLKEKNT